MEKEKDQRGSALVERLAVRYRQPLRRDTVVLHGRGSVTVYGCDGILCYTPEQICLRLGREQLRLYGRDLFCAAFTGSAVMVRGQILGLEYAKKNEKKEDGGRK